MAKIKDFDLVLGNNKAIRLGDSDNVVIKFNSAKDRMEFLSGNRVLDLSGGVKLGTTATEEEGVLRFSGSQLQIFRDGEWKNAGSLAIQDESGDLGEAEILNFVGDTIVAENMGNGVIKVSVPPPAWPSHFNSNDGTTNAVVPNVTTTIRNVSAPTTEGNPFKLGAWLAGSSQSCLNVSSLSYATPAKFIMNSNVTTLTVKLFDADGSTVISVNTVTLDGNKTITSQNIIVTVTQFGTISSKYECIVSVSINLGAILPAGGRFQISIEHTDGAAVYSKTQGPMFYDINDTAASIGSGSFVENSPIFKYNSGIAYYTTGSLFNITLDNIDNLNSDSYPSNQISIDALDYGINTINLQGNQLTGWVNVHDDTDDIYAGTHAINIVGLCGIGSANVDARTLDWTNGSWVNLKTENILIDTLSANATRVYEDFRNESRRLQSDCVTSWDSSQAFGVNDGKLLVSCSRLIYPQLNYSSYSPSGSLDLSGYAGESFYYTHFYHTNTSHSNGILRFSDHNLSQTDIDNEIVSIDISLDKTNWYSLNDEYLGGALVNGSGCRINPDTHSISADNSLEFTLGTGKFTDISSNWGIYVRLSWNNINKNKYIGIMEITNWI